MTFPHYTWGYIDAKRHAFQKFSVPSLYVRVYRYLASQLNKFRSSLTIREGISKFVFVSPNFYGFPHYTWGYIAIFVYTFHAIEVPSLYVRVYHDVQVRRCLIIGSLTIREGISQMFSAMERQALFPHYTWGYIADFCGKIWSMLRSLTIREGISMSTI